MRLIPKIDSNSIASSDIRNAIKELSEKSGVSIGAAQKPINVYLKFYCAIQNKREEILRELDCPIDSRIQIRRGQRSLNFVKARQNSGGCRPENGLI